MGATWTADGAWLTSGDVPPLHPGDPGEGGGLEDDQVGFRPLLPPEDRVWRHPSEVARARASARRARRRRIGAAALAGGVVAGAALAGVVGHDEPVSRSPAVAASTQPPATRGWLGVHGHDHEDGALVDDVVVGGPAHRTGVRPGDVVVSVDNGPTPSMGALVDAVSRRRPGDVVVLGVRRDGTHHEMRVALEARGG